MPKKLDDCVQDLINKGYSEDAAWAICTDAIENGKNISQAEADWKADNQLTRTLDIIGEWAKKNEHGD